MSRWLFFPLLFAATLLGHPVHGDPPSTRQPQGLRENRPQWCVLQGAQVVTAAGEAPVAAIVVVRDGVIVQVGGEAPAGAKPIALDGKIIYPGLIDAYSEVDVPDEAVTQGAVYWNSQVRAHVSVADFFANDSKLDEDYRSQGVVARLVAPASGIIRGQSAVVTTGREDRDRKIVRDQVAQHALLSLRRSSRKVYPNSPMGAVALSRQALYDARWLSDAQKASAADRALPRPERNDTLASLQEVIDGQPMFFETANELYLLRADRFAREFGLSAILLGSGHEYKRLAEVIGANRPLVVPVNFPKAPNVATRETERQATLEELMHWDIAPENPARLAKAGATFALTAHGLDSKKNWLKAIRQAVRRGLSKEDALRALTTTPAKLLGVDDRYGALQTGKSASFLVASGDLFDKKTKIDETWVDGERFVMTKPPLFDLEGSWSVKISGLKTALDLKITGTTKLSAKASTAVKKKSKSLDIKDVVLSGARLSLRFAGDKLDKPGTARLSALVSADGLQWEGQVVWGDQSSSAITATRQAESEDTKDDEKKVDNKKADKKKADKKKADEKKAGKKKAGKKKAGKKKDASKESDSDKDDEDSEDEDEDKDEDEDEDENESADLPASFAVNFPLGAFGRESLPSQATIWFTNATIWTSGPKGVIKNGSLLIRGGRIVSVHSQDDPAPEDATVVDLKGMHITPGIIDCHSHMATDGGINESAQAVTAEVRIGDFINCDDINIYRQLAGGVTSSNILHGSANPIGGQNQVIKLRWGALDEEIKFAEAPQGIKFALGENVKQSNWGEEHTTRYPQTRMGVVEIMRDTLEAAKDYRAAQRAFDKAGGMPVRKNLELEAVAEILEGTRWIHCHSYRQDEILALMRTLESYNVTIGTFQHILEGYKVADAMVKHGAMGSAFSDWWAYKFEVFDAIPFNGALMHRAGVVVSFNSDDRELARRLNLEAAKAVKYGGIEPSEALKFVTLNPAKQLRIEKYVGSIEPGKHADLAIWNGSPLSTYSRCEQTWVDGRKYFDRAEDLEVRKEMQQRRQTLVQKILDSGKPMLKAGERHEDAAALWPQEDEFCHHHGHGHDHGR